MKSQYYLRGDHHMNALLLLRKKDTIRGSFSRCPSHLGFTHVFKYKMIMCRKLTKTLGFKIAFVS